MDKPGRVLCIMDMSGVGRSSLAVVLPVLAACGVQGCPLPTTLLSSHTGGFNEVQLLDTVDFCNGALSHYMREEIAFDVIYVGYLLGKQQFDMVQRVFEQYPNAVKVVDPAMGDHGKIYSKITPDAVGWMKTLCQQADLITPNYTESALLTGEPFEAAAPTEEQMRRRLVALAAGKRQVVVTSVPTRQGGLSICGCDKQGQDVYQLPSHYVPQNYPGTGDLFAAALVGQLAKKTPIKHAAAKAASFVESAVAATYAARGEVRHGVWFEPFLHMLADTE